MRSASTRTPRWHNQNGRGTRSGRKRKWAGAFFSNANLNRLPPCAVSTAASRGSPSSAMILSSLMLLLLLPFVARRLDDVTSSAEYCTAAALGSALLSPRRVLHFAAVRSVSLFCLLVVCVLDLLCLVVAVESRCLSSARNGLDVDTTSEIFFMRRQSFCHRLESSGRVPQQPRVSAAFF